MHISRFIGIIRNLRFSKISDIFCQGNNYYTTIMVVIEKMPNFPSSISGMDRLSYHICDIHNEVHYGN